MEKEKIINGELYIFCETTGQYYPKYKMVNGIEMELDTKYFIYVLRGDTVDESLERDEDSIIHYPPEKDPILQKLDLSYYYGRERLAFLRQFLPDVYDEMLNDGFLENHLKEVDKTAREMEESLIAKYCQAEGVTTELKATKPLEWVGLFNNIKHRVREQIQRDLIYAF